MQVKRIGTGTVTLTPEGQKALAMTGGMYEGDRIVSLLAELGITAIYDNSRDDTEWVPIERAFFDSEGFGPYDRADL